LRVTEELLTPLPYGRELQAARLAGTQVLSRCIRGFTIGVSRAGLSRASMLAASISAPPQANAGLFSFVAAPRLAPTLLCLHRRLVRKCHGNEWRPVSNQGNSGLLTPRGLKITGTAFSNEPIILFLTELDSTLAHIPCRMPLAGFQVEATELAFRDSNWVDF